jgi:anaerobic ribonucleoside-triphosphate reductase
MDETGDCNKAVIGFFMERGLMNQSKVKNVDGKVGEGVRFERIRRITGYLVGTIDRFNDAKAKEVKERVKHGMK